MSYRFRSALTFRNIMTDKLNPSIIVEEPLALQSQLNTRGGGIWENRIAAIIDHKQILRWPIF